MLVSLAIGVIALVLFIWRQLRLDQPTGPKIPHGTAMNNTMRQTSGAMAIALLLTVMDMHAAMAERTGIPAAQASVSGVQASFRMVAIVCVICLAAPFFIRDRGRRPGQKR